VTFGTDTPQASTLDIRAQFFEDPESIATHAYQILCTGVSHFTSMLDVAELGENWATGNIDHGFLTKNVLWIHLFGGMMEVRAREFTLRRLDDLDD
jgi:hypothetical protein